MATENNGERQGLHQSLRSQMGYGTAALSAATNKTTPRTRRFISRRLLRTDTLMGIALKYGVTVQDLKKENKIWNSDHLFLRETLLIPVTPENETLLDENDVFVVFDGSSPSSSSSHLANGDAADPASSSSSSQPQSSGASASAGPKTRSQSTPSDFFSKYDNNIAKLKGDVAKMEKNAASLEGIIDANPLSLPPRKSSGTSRRDSNSSTSSASERRGHYMSDEDTTSSPVLVIRSRTNSRQVKSAIENLEQVSDDLYEL